MYKASIGSSSPFKDPFLEDAAEWFWAPKLTTSTTIREGTTTPSRRTNFIENPNSGSITHGMLTDDEPIWATMFWASQVKAMSLFGKPKFKIGYPF